MNLPESKINQAGTLCIKVLNSITLSEELRAGCPPGGLNQSRGSDQYNVRYLTHDKQQPQIHSFIFFRRQLLRADLTSLTNTW